MEKETPSFSLDAVLSINLIELFNTRCAIAQVYGYGFLSKSGVGLINAQQQPAVYYWQTTSNSQKRTHKVSYGLSKL